MKKAKKVMALGLAAVMAFGLSACGGRNAGNQAAQTQAPAAEGDNAAESQGGQASAAAVTIKIGHVEAEDRSTHKALVEYFKKTVEEKSGGTIKVEIHPNSALGGDSELTESVAMGTLEAALPSTSVLVAYSPDFGVMDMPWLFSNAENAFAAMDGDMGNYFNEKLEAVGIHSLGYSYNGLRSMTNNVRPITKPEDLKGLKMRVMENQVFIDFFNTLGASATPMSFSELFTGLQQNTIDGQENPPSLIYASKFQEVQKYLSVTEHVNNFLGFIMNKNFYDGLTAEQQQIITEAAAEFVKEQRKMELEDTNLFVEKLEEDGMQVNRLTEEDKAVFKEALAPMYDKYKAQFGEEVFNMAEKYEQ
ncbi:TRAP transporter substrate-binding protein [uncultured Clostridium sp.]|uniref:TRAP transporter substrate-binding protein n=1 Tax=uncultured Clostridium sp. TaxID=59620 RepID=UPI0025DD735E|nr:TRAP transporter substrate-binding protein [uncultured Clostridium sp.]